MNLIENFKKPIWFFVIGMIIVLFATFLKITGILLLLQLPLFIIGLLIEVAALITFLRKNKY